MVYHLVNMDFDEIVSSGCKKPTSSDLFIRHSVIGVIQVYFIPLFLLQTDVEEIVSVGPCVCKCKGTGNYITEAELALKIHLQKTKITLQKTNLTAYIRKLTSATDSRTSAQGLGYLGALVIAIVVCILILFDVLNCLQSKSSISRTKWEKTLI